MKEKDTYTVYRLKNSSNNVTVLASGSYKRRWEELGFEVVGQKEFPRDRMLHTIENKEVPLNS